MMVTFVGSAKNYKEMYDSAKSENVSLSAALSLSDQQYNAQVKKVAELETKLQQQLQDLQADKNQLAADLRKAERLAQQYQSEANSWKGVMTGFEQSVRNLQASLSQTQEQLDVARAQDIKTQKELNQMTADLYEKIVELQRLDADRRRLLEQKTELEKQISTGGTREVIPVTPLTRTAMPAAVVTASGDIKGRIADVNQNLVTLTVGSADGVQENMVFHITRGDNFLCDVIVTNVDINQCAGVLELVQQQPQVGDTASTQL
jgi:predicted  nucleic acid-binding Zn-ribbon protein